MTTVNQLIATLEMVRDTYGQGDTLVVISPSMINSVALQFAVCPLPQQHIATNMPVIVITTIPDMIPIPTENITH